MKTKRKNILLINPWIYDFSAFDLWSKPIGLLYVASFLRSIGYEVNFIDCMDRSHPILKQKLKNKIPKSKKFGTSKFYQEKIEYFRALVDEYLEKKSKSRLYQFIQ